MVCLRGAPLQIVLHALVYPLPSHQECSASCGTFSVVQPDLNRMCSELLAQSRFAWLECSTISWDIEFRPPPPQDTRDNQLQPHPNVLQGRGTLAFLPLECT